MAFAGYRRHDFTHLIRTESLVRKRNSTPRTFGIFVCILINRELFRTESELISIFLELIRAFRRHEQILVSITNRLSILSRISLLPNICCHKAVSATNLVQH